MPRVDPTEKELSRLRGLKLHLESDQLELGKALFHKSNLVVWKAASLVRDYQLHNLSEELERSFERWLAAAAKTDPGCRAKAALAGALCELERPCEELYLAGYQLVQLEKAYGGPEDTAAELRGICGLGLVRSHCDSVLERLADLLGDDKATTRVLAVQALLERGGVEAAALIRLRLVAGEDEPTVVLDCLTALLVITGDRGLEFSEKYLHSPRDPHWPVAVLALGESRLKEACLRLIELYSETVTQVSKAQVLEAIALSRLEVGLDFLFQVLEDRESKSGEIVEDLIRRFWGDSGTLARLDGVLEQGSR
jgi:hypothetical protein